MSLNQIFTIAGSGMSAQTLRLTTTASNLSNAEVASSKPETTYHPRYPVFETIQQQANQAFAQDSVGVAVKEIIESEAVPIKQHNPNHPLADENGFIYLPDVNVVEEMTNMISASRSYQMNIEVLNTTKRLMMQTLQLVE